MTQSIRSSGQFLLRRGVQTATNLAVQSASNALQNAILGPVTSQQEGPRREELRLQTAGEGQGIPRLYGRQRIGGQVIWHSPFTETTVVTQHRSGAKGVRRSTTVDQTTYRYTMSLAIGLCEGVIDQIGQVWADGQPFSLAGVTYRLYRGTEDQLPDPLIEAAEGLGQVPAYRGLAYIVIEDLDLEPFGNRLPQFNFEVERSLRDDDPGALENLVRAVTMIPASGETAYHTEPVFREIGEGITTAENVNTTLAETDAAASLDHLQQALPQAEHVALIVSWFGTDLRAGECVVEPRVELRDKTTVPEQWSVAGVTRSAATPVSEVSPGVPAYGGTPSDEGVRQIIRDMNSRGLAVTFYPFILMDIPEAAALPAPEDGQQLQGAYPWRGRITVAPRAVVDGTAAARTQIESFFSTYREMILHYAHLCAEAGGVDAFLVGSELRGLTTVRDETGAFPAVQALAALVGEVRTILGAGVKLSYAADWTEYGAYQANDGTGDVLFPLDSLWADENVDAVAIDNYMPLTDWRPGEEHLDALSAWEGPHDHDYLSAGISGGEGYEWFYADQAARDNQIRTQIRDTAHGEDWIFRVKDLTGWWQNAHHPRPAGTRAAVPTQWVPESKPIWFTELGCAAIDKGSNQPNVFYDPKSVESAVPYFSTGARDDVGQRHFLEAHLRHWMDQSQNPLSSIYGGQMVDQDRIYLYTWDARPFPAFPVESTIWADAENWTFGHWLNGRVGKVSVGRVIEDLARSAGLAEVASVRCDALIVGYLLPDPITARAAIDPLLEVYQLDMVERNGGVQARPRTGKSLGLYTESETVDDAQGQLTVTRAQATELPAQLSVTFSDPFNAYQSAVVNAFYPGAEGGRTSSLETAIVFEEAEAQARVTALLAETRAARLSARVGLAPGEVQWEPADVISIQGDGSAAPINMRITDILDGTYRRIDGVLVDEGSYQISIGQSGATSASLTPALVAGPAVSVLMDLPLLPSTGEDGLYVRGAAFASPWPGAVQLYQGAGEGAALRGGITHRSVLGRLTAPLAPGRFVWRWDWSETAQLSLSSGALESKPEEAVLRGESRLAVQLADGRWELLSFREATLEEGGVWHLRGLLRGERGTEDEARLGAPTGARVVLLDDGQETLPLDLDLLGAEGTWQAVPETASPGSFPAVSQTLALGGASLRPFAPVHLRATSDLTGVAVSWTRRTRIGGDNWALADVPLGEASESYEVTGFDENGAMIESQTVTQSSAQLTAQGISTISVAQISATYGAGRAASVAVSV